MKKRMVLLWAFLLLALSLTGCGEDETSNSANRSVPNTGVTGDQMLENGVNNTAGDMKNGVKKAADDYNGVTHTPAEYGVSYGQMLRNGKVHDSDGYLNNRENAYHPGSLF